MACVCISGEVEQAEEHALEIANGRVTCSFVPVFRRVICSSLRIFTCWKNPCWAGVVIDCSRAGHAAQCGWMLLSQRFKLFSITCTCSFSASSIVAKCYFCTGAYPRSSRRTPADVDPYTALLAQDAFCCPMCLISMAWVGCHETRLIYI